MNVTTWWTLLCVVAAINVAAWSCIALGRRTGTDAQTNAFLRAQLALSGVYVFGCAFRSVLPVFDIPRMCLVDSWLSSVLVGRTVATVAELAFAAQWALLLRAHARATGNALVRRVSQAIVPMLAIAEICSWSAVLTRWNLGHVFENSLWGMSGALLVAGLLILLPGTRPGLRPLFIMLTAGGVTYVGFMFIVDVPMYWARWIADEANARVYLDLSQGIADASSCKVVSFRWEDWRHEVGWMTLYFSAGVWSSISLIFAAPAARALETHDDRTETGQ
jgi:hypothetical protein